MLFKVNMNLGILLLALCATMCYADTAPERGEEPRLPELDIETVTQLIRSLQLQNLKAGPIDYDVRNLRESVAYEDVRSLRDSGVAYEESADQDHAEQPEKLLRKRSEEQGYMKYMYRKPLSQTSKYESQTVPVREEPYEDEELREMHQLLEDRWGAAHNLYEPYQVPKRPQVGSLKGEPGVDYPNYTEIPLTKFTCADKKHIPGFYADKETRCQVFHICYKHRRESFLCPVGTTFNQPILACDYWYNGNCSASSVYYGVNEEDHETYYEDISHAEEVPVEEMDIYTETPEEEHEKVYHTVYEPQPTESPVPSPSPIVPIATPQPQTTYVKFLPVKSKVTKFQVPSGSMEGHVKISSKPFNANIHFSGFAPFAKGVDVSVQKPVPVQRPVPTARPIPIPTGAPVPTARPVPIPTPGPTRAPSTHQKMVRVQARFQVPNVQQVSYGIPAAVPVHVAAPFAKVLAKKTKKVLTKKGLALALLKMLSVHAAPYNVAYGGAMYHY